MKRESGPWLAGALIVIALLFLGLYEVGILKPLESALGYVVAPVERGLSFVFGLVGDLSQTAQDVGELQQQVETLQKANNVLIQENIRLRQYEAENRECRTQLNFAQENPTYSLIGGDVVERGCEVFPCGHMVGRDTNPYLRYVIINVGSRHGVAVGMPVVTGGAALIGRIARVSPNLSYVQLINDPQSEIAAMFQQSRVTGLLIGTPEGGLYLTDILPDEEINEGETIITSAVGGRLPRGLILGQVETISYQEADLFQEASIRPAIDFRQLETVLVITEFPQPDLDELESEDSE